ncbi:putative colanic acid biosynthesis acetyltransferase WcaF [Flavobacterium sp. CG_9.1]|uniref:WcaF family extracellular polysaccharide biosynthesis acetyltransferase n=1 Tax=Flavobacterium sp. CG_9.1 TaxID=2787728 RepID=UPI0018CA3F67|nr:WcaF family extracellular polysaccharide biosynthesis acetyltransferase [Flavobacterium sp. CG_9.1]MBG6062549.1 putative colanic acid biosynthesis acetyltransferase WcaF [Flavobacterium sp. CG_9.1]
MKIDLSKYNNSWYNPGPKWKQILWYFVSVLLFVNPLNPLSGFKILLLRLFGAKVGTGVHIKPGVTIKYPWLLDIGNHVWIGENVWIDNLAKVTIESNVCISQGAMLLCGNHNYKTTTFDLIIGEIHLQEGSWIGAKSIVCPGVTLHSHAILAVGSVATSNLDSLGIYQGNPAVKIRQRKIEE